MVSMVLHMSRHEHETEQFEILSMGCDDTKKVRHDP